ncbi:MAG: hypothetical protein PUD59_00120 [bacterium]|nr:hypothetical protein [bacterium]
MTNLFQIMDNCGGLGVVVSFIKKGVFPVIWIGIPILLILMGTLDLGKAVVSNDEKEIKGATSKLIKRAIMAVAVFFVTTLVYAVLGWVAPSTENNVQGAIDYKKCWDNPLGNDSSADDK